MNATYDLRASQYDHPERQPGQHTNGRSRIFVRRSDGPWYRVRYHAQHKVGLLIAMFGFDAFVSAHCDPVPSELSQ